MSFGPADLCAVLQEHLPPDATGLVVAVSGGADSACLAAALMQARQLPAGARLRALPARAVHVDHGLQAASAAFREAGAALCTQLNIPLTILAVQVDTAAGASLEAAARDARYRAFALELKAGECLLTAHHAEDQAETLLLQLFRGSGLPGLSAMPLSRPLGLGRHLRPLLNVAQRDLSAFAQAQGIEAADDPMNHDLRFDRAYVRSQLWPLIEQRWPGAATALTRTARHLAEAQELLEQSAAFQVQRLRDGDALRLGGLRALSASEQINTLRHWLSSAEVGPPPAARLAEALRQAFVAEADHLPAIVWGPHALRRYRERLFLTPATPPALGAERAWCAVSGAPLELGQGLGRLRWVAQTGGLDAGRVPGTLSVRQRRGGEEMKIGPRAKTQSVQHLCQSVGILPWMRDALPLLYAGDALIAIGDLWQDARWCVAAGEPGFGCLWDEAPNLV